jgi:hypothetical protein
MCARQALSSAAVQQETTPDISPARQRYTSKIHVTVCSAHATILHVIFLPTRSRLLAQPLAKVRRRRQSTPRYSASHRNKAHASTCSPEETFKHLRASPRFLQSSYSTHHFHDTTTLHNPANILRVRQQVHKHLNPPTSCLASNPITSWLGALHHQDEGRSAACRLARRQCPHIFCTLRASR